MGYVIIGSGPAAVGCITGIRKVDKSNPITVISKDDNCYSKPLIPNLITGVNKESIIYRNDDFFNKNGVRFISNTTAKSIDTGKKKVTLDSKKGLDYDSLLIATGSKPLDLKIKGIEKEGIFTFYDVQSALSLRDFIQTEKVKHAVVIGSGFVGIEVAIFLRNFGVNVTVITRSDRVLRRDIDEKASKIVEQFLDANGIKIVFNSKVEEVLGEKRIKAVKLETGKVIDCQSVIMAVGTRPNNSIFSLDADGIDVDEYMHTKAESVFAAGDCIRCIDITDGKRKNIPSFELAFEQGFVAGINMAGKKLNYLGGLKTTSLSFVEKPIVSVGVINPADRKYEVFVNDKLKRSGYYRKVVIRDNKLVGFEAIGNIDRTGILTGIIRQGIDVSQFKEKLSDVNFGLAFLPRKWRDEKIVNDRTDYIDWGPRW